jgi:hypothetical protein
MDGNTRKIQESAAGREPQASGKSQPSAAPPAPMTDTEFAEAVDARLWVFPSGEMRDNEENYIAVEGTLQERSQAIGFLHDLVEALLPLYPWREHPELARPVLESLLFVEEQSSQRELTPRKSSPVEATRDAERPGEAS